MKGSKSFVFRFFCFFVALILFLELKISSAVADEGSDEFGSCNEDLSAFLPVPFGNLTDLHCDRIWNTFILRFSQTEDHIVNIILSAEYTSGWVGMGFSKDGTMVGSSAMVGWIHKSGRGTIKQYYLRGYSVSEVIADKGEMPLTNIPPAVVVNGAKIYLAFQLKLTDGLTKQQLILAFGIGTPTHSKLTRHEDKTTISFDFSQGSPGITHAQNTTAGPTTALPHNISKMRKSHGALGLIGWGIILPVGYIVARYYRHSVSNWYYIHAFIQFVGFLIGLAAVLTGKVLSDKVHIQNIASHVGIGSFVLALSILQVLAFFLRPDTKSNIRRYWNWYHNWVGKLALFLGAVNILVGATRENTDYFYLPLSLTILTVIVIAYIVLEVLMCKRISLTKLDSHSAPSTEMNKL